eukprot:CAMPEP_0183303526 /NCGR_PEP_ID=MMETSP0160_2-20130417/8928_1 /TAXON_ID=2839 ORGANISM="Odontella Sinensis, Strain Grunow 1884" /NCGR_SAMPLE_ID=MMETSP0160_2 /ASSEMBLY_ACC=CAM_ASM_000250 /LENGTH=75 /DNA_ID=CAMNT_0025466439 /DNA_START=138 /DNA_END=365 /DNA_ORIENTATION=+
MVSKINKPPAQQRASAPIQEASSDQTNNAKENRLSENPEVMAARISSGHSILFKPRRKEKHFLCEEFVNEISHGL